MQNVLFLELFGIPVWRKDVVHVYLAHNKLSRNSIHFIFKVYPLIFITFGGNDAEAETPVLWPPDAELTHWKRP